MTSPDFELESQLVLLNEKEKELARRDAASIQTIYGQAPELVIPLKNLSRICFDQIDEALALEQLNRVIDPLDGVAVAGISVSEADQTPEYNLFRVPFGRDAMLFALDLLAIQDSSMRKKALDVASQTLRYFGSCQGTKDEDVDGSEFGELRVFTMERMGKIPHEVRDPKVDVIAQKLSKERQFGWPYFASMDATPLFVILAYRYLEAEGDEQLFDEMVERNDGVRVSLKQCVAEAVGYLVRQMDESKSGLIESRVPNERAAQFQGWRDAFDAHYIEDTGDMVPWMHSVASIEIQGLAFDAIHHAMQMKILDAFIKREDLIFYANTLREEVLKTFFYVNRRGEDYFALGFDRYDGEMRLHTQKSSAMGWLLNSEMLVGEKYAGYRDAILKTLMKEDMKSRWGIRTLSSESRRYLPSSYHNGSIWMMDNVQILKGLVKHGYMDEAYYLASAVASAIEKSRLFAEFQRGDDSDETILNTYSLTIENDFGVKVHIVQPPQPVQAWTISAYLYANYMLRELQNSQSHLRHRLS